MTKHEFFVHLAKSAIKLRLDEECVLACMILMHIYRFELCPSVSISDADGASSLAPVTRRYAAEIVAELLAESLAPQSTDSYWVNLYDNITPFETVSDVTEHWKPKLDRMAQLVRQSNLVSELVVD